MKKKETSKETEKETKKERYRQPTGSPKGTQKGTQKGFLFQKVPKRCPERIHICGLAKTLLIRSLARLFQLQFNRIQCTPDLMPSDITGTDIVQEDPESGRRQLEFLQGPVLNPCGSGRFHKRQRRRCDPAVWDFGATDGTSGSGGSVLQERFAS